MLFIRTHLFRKYEIENESLSYLDKLVENYWIVRQHLKKQKSL